MKQYFKLDEWCIIEENFDTSYNEVSESICSLGNGHMGQRANFEEFFSGPSLPGSYMAGVYYPDKTRVGWWKNGYPEYFAKVLNSTNWIGINIEIDGENLDLFKCKVEEFRKVLNMKDGYLQRTFIAELKNGKKIKVDAKRFLSIERKEIGAIRYSVKPINFSGEITFIPYLDGDVKNNDSNYDEKFWNEISQKSEPFEGYVTMKTKKLDFHICSYMKYRILLNNKDFTDNCKTAEKSKYVDNKVTINCSSNDEVVLYKYVANVTSRDYEASELLKNAKDFAGKAYNAGFDKLFNEQKEAWQNKWKESDIVIEGDVAAQQAIRFNIFQLNQTYSGKDSRLNIGPKGFTGEKYGGSTYWDTEAYCLPFYLGTADEQISRNLLVYRYNQLEKAKENARSLGFAKGALYPMVTMNGEECHNEWEITFEEIHRNGAIAYAIYNYVEYTGDKTYLGEYGFEVLVEIARFWAERITFSTDKKQYVMLGVTGPNEYENNVNNNWYTSTLACWTMKYTIEVMNYLKEQEPSRLEELLAKLDFREEETAKWEDIIKNMYFPENKELGIFLQQDGYLDKEQILVKDLPEGNLPLNQKWSWDRILRSCFIKQADVLQGIYFFEDNYDIETIKRNFDFYEPRTVHESSLSPCVHSILAAKIGYYEKAYEMYLRTARLDLDNYNNDTCDGCHITSMAGTWLSVVQGFGGMRVKNGELHLNPFIPSAWNSFAFRVTFRGSTLNIHVNKENIQISNHSNLAKNIYVFDKEYITRPHETLTIKLQ